MPTFFRGKFGFFSYPLTRIECGFCQTNHSLDYTALVLIPAQVKHLNRQHNYAEAESESFLPNQKTQASVKITK